MASSQTVAAPQMGLVPHGGPSQELGSTSHLLLTLKLSMHTPEEHLDLGSGSVFTVLKKYCHKTWKLFWSTRQSRASCKEFPCKGSFWDYGFPLCKISTLNPRISSPCGSSRLVHLAHRKISQNLFSCCKISLGNLDVNVQLLFPTSKKWPRRAACGTTPEITSLKHLGKKIPAGGCFVGALLDEGLCI